MVGWCEWNDVLHFPEAACVENGLQGAGTVPGGDGDIREVIDAPVEGAACKGAQSKSPQETKDTKSLLCCLYNCSGPAELHADVHTKEFEGDSPCHL